MLSPTMTTFQMAQANGQPEIYANGVHQYPGTYCLLSFLYLFVAVIFTTLFQKPTLTY